MKRVYLSMADTVFTKHNLAHGHLCMSDTVHHHDKIFVFGGKKYSEIFNLLYIFYYYFFPFLMNFIYFSIVFL